MKIKNKLILLTAAAALVFMACSKDKQPLVSQNQQVTQNTPVGNNPQQRDPVTTGITCSDGLLSFDTYDNFKLVVEDIQSLYDSTANSDTTDSEVSPKSFEANFNYVSLRSVLYTAHTNALNNEIYNLAADPFSKYIMHTGIRTVCNSSGEVKIAGKLYIFADNNESYIVESGDRIYTQQINNDNFANMDGVTRFATDGSVIQYNNNGTSIIFPPGDCAQAIHSSIKYYGNNNNKMLYLSVWVTNGPFVNSHGSEVRAYQKVLGHWIPYFATNLSVDYGGTIRYKNCLTMTPANDSKPPMWAQVRHVSNDAFTPNSLAFNVYRTANHDDFLGGGAANNCSYFYIYVR